MRSKRGHKAVHNPLKGQVLAMNLERYGKQVQIPLLISAMVASIGGFALFNQGLFETIGRGWYAHRGRAKGADLRRLPGLCPREGPRDYRRAGSGQVAPSLGCRDRSPGRVAGLDPPDRVQGILHTGIAPSDLRLPAARETAGGNHHRFLEPPRVDPRAGSKCPSHLRHPRHPPVAGVAAPGAISDQGATGPTAIDPGDDRPLDHPSPDPSSSRPARAGAGDCRCRARPSPGNGFGPVAGCARPRPQRGRAAERGRSAGAPGEPPAEIRPYPAWARSGPWQEGAGDRVGFQMENAWRGDTDTATRSSWRWRRWRPS